MNARRKAGEEGAALVIVLIFISVFGLILSGLMTEGSVNVKYTTIVDGHEGKVYAADAGVSFGIQQLRQTSTLCPRPGVTGPAIPPLSIDGRAVTVTCNTNSGSNGGTDGYGIITTSPNAASLSLSNSHAKKIEGSVYIAGGVDWGPGLKVAGGDFFHQKHGASCLDPPSAGDLTVTSPPYGYYCKTTTELPAPVPLHVAPAMPTVPPNPGYTDLSGNTCRTFKPGLYTSRPTLRGGDNYFQSGVYYFNFNDVDDSKNVIEVKQATIYGGQPTAAEKAQQRFALPPDCASQVPTPADPKTGVEFIFGDRARMLIDTSGQVELFGRTGEPSPATSNISFVAVPSGDPANWPTGVGNWTASTLTNTSASPCNTPSGDPCVLDIKDGNQQDLAIHGVVYAPTVRVALTATNNVLAQSMSGLVAWTLEMKSSASAQGLAVSVAPGASNPRRILITAIAQGKPAEGGRPVQSSGVVEVANDNSKTVTVESWRTRGPSDPL